MIELYLPDNLGKEKTPNYRQYLTRQELPELLFFANAISTISKGLDVVITHDLGIGNDNLRTSLAATFSNTIWDQEYTIE